MTEDGMGWRGGGACPPELVGRAPIRKSRWDTCEGEVGQGNGRRGFYRCPFPCRMVRLALDPTGVQGADHGRKKLRGAALSGAVPCFVLPLSYRGGGGGCVQHHKHQSVHTVLVIRRFWNVLWRNGSWPSHRRPAQGRPLLVTVLWGFNTEGAKFH